MFVDINCESSFYLFSKQNTFRISCYRMINHRHWDNFVIWLIFFSSVKLALDTYLSDNTSLIFMQLSDSIDYGLNFCFIFEMVVKMIASGIFMDEGSYFRESWNQLDFVIVLSSIFDMCLSGSRIKTIKVLRLLRTLRPLRVISHNEELKIIVVSLMDSIGGIFNVLIVVMAIWLIFGIIGVNFFGGKFNYCDIDVFKLKN